MSLTARLLKPVLGWYLKRSAPASLPDYEANLQLEGLSASVEIIRDNWAVPHIYAENEADMYFAQGFVHAQDRLWQMTLYRHLAQGRLSELIGKDALDADRISRTLGFGRLAKLDADELNKTPLGALLQAYAKGVEAGTKSLKGLAPEFKLLRVKKLEAWTAEDSLAIARLMAFEMSYGWAHELLRLDLYEQLGPERSKELFPQYFQGNPVALQQNLSYRRLEDGRLEAFAGPYLRPSGASNNWVVAASRMASGSASLANDPHLLIGLPGIWYENHLSCPAHENTGVSIPGTPLVLIGHNRKIAWGCTLSFADMQDLYIEEFAAVRQYHYGEQIRKADVVEERIYIKGKAEPHIETVVYTHNGPIISELIGQARKLSLASPVLRDSSMMAGFYGLNAAEDWDGFVKACGQIAAPSLNIVYADTSDNIGYVMTGRIPIRKRPKNGLPALGRDPENRWTGYVPTLEMPHVFNPPKGYFYTCNHRIVGDDFPHDLGQLWMNGYRAARLQELFDQHEGQTLSLSDFCAWQQDFKQMSGLRWQAWLLQQGFKAESTQGQAALERVLDWDGILGADSVGGCILQVWKQSLIEVLGEKLGLSELQRDQFRGKGRYPIFFRLCEFFGHEGQTLFRLLENPQAACWQGENPLVLLNQALEKALVFLRERLGEDIMQWQWGRLHQIRYAHILGNKAPLDQFFNRGPFPIGGDGDTLNQTNYAPDERYAGGLTAASYRLIVDMGHFDESLSRVPAGQSGHLYSLHYDDQIQAWLKGEYKPLLWSREAVLAHARYRSSLKP